MKLRPLFKWFGSKWSGAKHYPEPLHVDIFEPYAGAAGYSLNHADYFVHLWDTDPHLAELWPWLIRCTPQDVQDIPIDVPAGTDIRMLGLSQGQALLMKSWQRTNNVGDCWTVSKWGHLPGQWTANTRARVAEESQAIKHWTFEPPDWTQSGTWFIDPPYEFNYRYRAAPLDYDALAWNVHSLPPDALAIVCEAACPKTGRVPSYLPFRASHSQVTSRRKAHQSNHSAEVVFVRQPA